MMAETNSNSSSLFIEFTQTSASILSGEKTLTVALENGPNGQLSESARAALKQAVSDAVNNSAERPSTAYCAVSARGVSLRKLQLPPTKSENLRQMLSFQIEKEFPLGPDELAWGFQLIDQTGDDSNPQEALLVAVKKELIEDYAEVFSEIGISPVFTVGILSDAVNVASTVKEPFALLNIGTTQTEFVFCENGVPSTIRTIPVGASGEMALLAEKLKKLSLPDRVFLNGELTKDEGRVKSLEEALDLPARGESLRIGKSFAAIDALQQLVSQGDANKLLTLRVGGGEVQTLEEAKPFPVKWAAVAVALFVGLLVMRYVEPMIKKSALETKIAEVDAARETLPPIEDELGFLRYLESSRPAYLNAVTVLADSIPRGTKLDALSLSRQGDFTFRATLKTQQEATALREKLLESGLFATVVLEEQTPSKNPKGLTTRISARWIPDPKTPSKTIDKIIVEFSPDKDEG